MYDRDDRDLRQRLRLRVMLGEDVAARRLLAIMDERDALRAWIENVATDSQLDQPVPALEGRTGRQLLTAFARGGRPRQS